MRLQWKLARNEIILFYARYKYCWGDTISLPCIIIMAQFKGEANQEHVINKFLMICFEYWPLDTMWDKRIS